MFTYYLWWAGYRIGRLWTGLRRGIVHSWERFWYKPLVVRVRINMVDLWNATPNREKIVIGWLFIRWLLGDLDLLQALDDLAINILASYLTKDR